MKIYCVIYIEDGVYLEMCYPAMSAKIAENIGQSQLLSQDSGRWI